MTPWKRNPVRTGLILAILVAMVGLSRAERLPIRAFTTEDGLPSNLVGCIYRDSHDFMWFGTRHGLARHDGHLFVTFDEDDGIPRAWIRDIMETREGQMLVATDAGIHWFDRSETGSDSLFRLLPAADIGPGASVQTFYQDASGTVWVGTSAGLYRAAFDAGGWTFEVISLLADPDSPDQAVVNAIAEDDNALWIGTGEGLVRLPPNGRPERYTSRHGLTSEWVLSLYQDSRGAVWLGTMDWLSVLVENPAPDRPVVTRLYTEADGLLSDRHGTGSGPSILDVLETDSGRLWVVTHEGLSEFQPDARGEEPAFRSYGEEHGLSVSVPMSLGQDVAGNLWVGTEASGAMKLVREGFTTFGLDDGLGDLRVSSMVEDRSGTLHVISEYGNGLINRFDGRRFEAVRPAIPPSIENVGWGSGQVTLQDREGQWWVPTFEGLCRFPRVASLGDLARVRPMAVYTTRDGLISNGVFRLFEDSRGDLWIGLMALDDGGRSGVQRWERATGTFHDLTDVPGLPSDSPTAFAEDLAGNLWIAFYNEGIGRLRQGRFDRFPDDRDVLGDFCEDLYLDRQGRVWIASTRSGVILVDEPDAERPTFKAITPVDGLSGSYIICITEDDSGRIYLGHMEGVDRIDPTTGMVRRFTSKDGLPTTYTRSALTDRKGAVWIGTLQGVSRLVASPDRPAQPPPVWIQSVHIAGRPFPISPLGNGIVDGLVLNPTQRQLEIEASGLVFAAGETLRFQYRLDGSRKEWSAPRGDRKVNLAGLSPGRYRFEVRAMDSGGLVSPEPAVVSFRVLPPFWQTWWFVSLAAALVAGGVYVAHRSRVRRLLELERVRTRIATDLHDDIGASLSQVSILSEVVRQQIHGDDPKAAEPLLDQIAGSARDLVDSMSDIVWAVNPKRDRAGDLVQRMRRFASDTLSGKGIVFRFASTTGELERRLDVDVRRQVYLVFKEAVNNAARHAECGETGIEFGIDGKWLVLRVADDGRGFVPSGKSEGHGLASMRQRAEDLGGTLEVESAEGRGTTVTLRVPLGRGRN